VQNAQEATPASGAIRVQVARSVGKTVLEVVDEGEGMSPEFVRDRLFRPFDSTKGRNGMGIGAYEVREFINGLGGEVNVESLPGKGTRFRIAIPVAETTPAQASETVTAKEGER